MNVISGKFKGHNIKSPHDLRTHPMGSREKLALFNMLAPYLENADVLDAFAGSGALGIEALSRGAKTVTFIEKAPKIARTIRENLQSLGLSADIIISDVKNAKLDQSFDIIIADPPYDHFILEDVVYLTTFIKDDGILALSHPDVELEIPGFRRLSTHKYASANLSIYIKT